MRFTITFLRGKKVVATLRSGHNTDIQVSELKKVIEVEQFLERLTGLRVHITETH